MTIGVPMACGYVIPASAGIPSFRKRLLYSQKRQLNLEQPYDNMVVNKFQDIAYH